MLVDDAENIVRTVIDRAVGGDATCLRLCLERLLPPVRERSVEIPLPDVSTVGDAVAAMTVVVGRMARGQIAPGEAAAVAGVVENFRRTVETQDLERRICELEASRGQQ
jgi:translation elongation factor EF-Tu-like GTPase